MSAAPLQLSILPGAAHRLLLAHYGGRRLEGHIEVDGHAVTRIGTAALQLLWLARRDVIDQAHEWRWLSASEPLRRAARQLFMTDALGLPRDAVSAN